LAYGQTGTGKSLTISGLENPYEDRGILPRMVSDLFRKVETETAKIHIKMCIKVSFVEFSRTNINDLLQPYPNMIHSLKEMTTARVKSADEALKIIFRGEGRKVYSEFASYPSHSCNSIFTFYIATKNLEMQDNSLTKCKVSYYF
jgi:kinesin family protein 6/9